MHVSVCIRFSYELYPVHMRMYVLKKPYSYSIIQSDMHLCISAYLHVSSHLKLTSEVVASSSSRAGGTPGWLLNLRPGNLERKTTSINDAGEPYSRLVDYSPAELHHPGRHRPSTNPRARHATSLGHKPRPTRITVLQGVSTAGPTSAQIFPWSDSGNARADGSTSFHTGRMPLRQTHPGRPGPDTA